MSASSSSFPSFFLFSFLSSLLFSSLFYLPFKQQTDRNIIRFKDTRQPRRIHSQSLKRVDPNLTALAQLSELISGFPLPLDSIHQV